MLGRLSLNPFRHVDPIGTVVVPGVLLAIGAPLIGWAKPVPVVTSALKHPRRALVCVALAGPLANLLMAAIWCIVLLVIMHVRGNETLISWIEYMCEAGIWVNVTLAVFNLLPVPPLDGGRVLMGVMPARWGTRLASMEPVGLLLVLGLSVVRGLDWVFLPTYRVMGRIMAALFAFGAAA
jgi:Zn-dependent protease